MNLLLLTQSVILTFIFVGYFRRLLKDKMGNQPLLKIKEDEGNCMDVMV